jgi:hypothetical protein
VKTLALLLFLCGLAAADIVVLRDRTILEGAVTKGDKTLTAGSRTLPLHEVILWEDKQGIARYTPGFERLLQAYGVLADREALQACLDLLPQAVEASAASVARRLLARAERAGLAPKDAERWAKQIGSLAEDKESEIKAPPEGASPDMLLDRARKHLDADMRDRGLRLLRAVLASDPKHEAATAYVNTLVPKRWKVGDGRTWVDWEIEVLPGRERMLRRRNPDMERARTFWGRSDLHGVETRVGNTEIVLITPKTEAGIVAMCVRLSRLTCASLEKMFRIENPAREDADPLVIYLYENKQEYIDTSKRGMGGGPAQELGVTAGHYTPRENISRFFWPGNHSGAARSVRDTFVHELTHHWIERCNPRWHARDLSSMRERVQTPGYWIVEGFAVFIQEGRYDQERSTWTHFNPHAHTLDIVSALSESGELIPWDEVYPLTQAQFHGPLRATATKLHARAKCRWTLRPVPLSKIVLFYQQSGATCHFLYWGENGKHRDKLLQYVTDFYTSKRERTNIESAFGMTPEELGKKVEAYATAVRDGWRPKQP